MKAEALRILKEYYGYENFREGQEKIIDAICNHRNVLGIMTTGAGKSICYQIPALIFNGLTLIISPLISLMKDQVDSLRTISIEAEYLNSTLSFEEVNKILFKIYKKKVKILYISPERLENSYFVNYIENIDVSMVVVDEAHCISQWGENFRKSYLKISDFIKFIDKENKILTLAFTATATPRIKNDIVQKLNMQKPFIFTDYFDRDNIYFKVVDNTIYDDDLIDEKSFIKNYLLKNKGKSGIIYCSTRKNVEDIYNYIKNILGKSVTKYHAGLSKEQREQNQQDFLNDNIEIMVATNAFGMGINKSNIRYVIHANIPSDLENYYQEAGRAGRDGAPAEAILIYNKKDISTQRFLIENDSSKDEEYNRRKLRKFQKMQEYAELQSCYREFILKYFGEKMIRDYCGHCENCKKEKDVKDFSLEAKKIISCVGRTKESLGISTLSNMLVGKADSKMLNKGLDKISTFGIMREESIEWIENFINYMILEKYLVQSAGSFPVLKLGEKYKDILEDRLKIIRKSDEKVNFDYFENDLFKNLIALRKEIANTEKIAPYIVFSDMTLIEMAEKKPLNRWEMLKIKGIGNQKFNNYGEKFLELITNFK
ncbi:DNA helicase RecQ [Fusobacterium gastrosuis]|uniref:DNA helicase RecQ n=1 Tax=Fusobacterium gastrosuis TaxID=1755100 RepID=UPI0029716849|nr:DNA helicase RecQ [Fusobacteriaceae bacterium]MDY5713203.1 DNA helicase RecQ [Fusobacterium gastrosuis]